MNITTKIIVAGAGVLAVVAGGSAAIAAVDRPAPKVTAEQAIQIALKEVPGAWVREAGFDGRGTQADVWEVELVAGDQEHEVDIDAATGKLLKKETERLDGDDDNVTAGQPTQSSPNAQSTQGSDDGRDDSDDSQDDD